MGTDIHPNYLIPSIHFLNQFYQVPKHSSSHYYLHILKIIKKEKINIVLPIFDADQILFYPENEDLKKLNVISLGTPFETLKIYKNKNTMFDFLKNYSFKIPKILQKENLNLNQNYFIKPIDGFGSKNTQVLKGKEILKLNTQNYIIQELLLKPEITLECFYYNKQIKTIARERIEVKSGVCVKAKVFYHFDLEKIALKLAQTIQTPFYFNLQFMQNKQKEWILTDINLRFAAGMSLSHKVGWNAVLALHCILLNQKEKVLKCFPNKILPTFVVRYYEDVITKTEKECVAFDLDGTLLNSFNRHQIVLNDILKKYNFNIHTEKLIFHKRKGKSNVDFLIQNGINFKLAKTLQKEWIQNIENEKYLKYDDLYPQAIHLLEKYKKNYDLILITARQNKNNALKQIKNLNIQHYFKKVFVVSPKNAVFEKTNILKNENVILMFGDSEIDLQSSLAAQVDFKFLSHGFRNLNFMKKFLNKTKK